MCDPHERNTYAVQDIVNLELLLRSCYRESGACAIQQNNGTPCGLKGGSLALAQETSCDMRMLHRKKLPLPLVFNGCKGSDFKGILLM